MHAIVSDLKRVHIFPGLSPFSSPPLSFLHSFSPLPPFSLHLFISPMNPLTSAGFKELMGVFDTLTKAASSGTLDTGYEVTGMEVKVPEDACGVPGGDSSTCKV